MESRLMSLAEEVVSATARYVPRMCWSNAVEALLTSDHPALEGAVYVEGWAIPDGVDVALEHAWLKLRGGTILDVTWLDQDARYFAGVEYSRDELARLDPDFLPLVWVTSGWSGFGNAAYLQSYLAAQAACT